MGSMAKSDGIDKEVIAFSATRMALGQIQTAYGKDVERYRRRGWSKGLTCGEELSLDEEKRLQISWAATPSGTAGEYKKALIQEYESRYGHKPCYQSKAKGCVPGNIKGGRAASWARIHDLDWSDWHDALTYSAGTAPKEPGVYRVRAV